MAEMTKEQMELTVRQTMNLLAAYINFKGDEKEFKGFLISKEKEMREKQEANAKNDTKISDKPSDKSDS